ncbi:MAG: 16S rRNA (cytidine(1402)-2'-O)-methyltransferase [Acaryochloridaceae cyanobacterium SU_2_1]|nr:16S rRNA (cytidine(1402)-2'-O)-methyltransferase [Acaryochloridaceae cyanobacterium SU_2_1]
MTHSNFGLLYIVGTPIGNLEDISVRAIGILQRVHLIAAEDTRHTGKLLHHFQIATPQISYHQHNIHTRTPELINRLQQGQDLALVSDAGTPGISDPGMELVQACVQAGITVVPIPGANAAIAALIASGLDCDRFCFEGFLPLKGQARQQRLAQMAEETRTIIFYEAPHRLRQTLTDLTHYLDSQRQIVLARELTKRYEEIWRGSVAAAIALYQTQTPKGEFTLVLAGHSPLAEQPSAIQLQQALQTLIQQGYSLSQASREVAAAQAVSRRQVYQLALELKALESSPPEAHDLSSY